MSTSKKHDYKRVISKTKKLGTQTRSRIGHFYRRGISKIQNDRFAFCVRHKKGKMLTLDVADMFYMQVSNKELFRYDMIVRYLAIENYYGKNEIGFTLYRKMQQNRIGSNYGDEAVPQFKKLIHSYEENGYDATSYIVVDKNLNLVDGSHRMAMALYHHIATINVLVVNTPHKVDYSIDWFFQKGFTDEEINLILSTAEKIKNEINLPFSCVIWDPAYEYRKEIIHDLEYFGNVLEQKEYEFRPAEYQNVVRCIYAIDDIEQWKIEKKIEYMGSEACRAIEVKVKFEDPLFRIKSATGMPLSIMGERAKETLRERYRPKIKNYFFDIIMHIGDNHMQSDYMHKVFEPGINFKEVITFLNQYCYVLTKIDVPFMPLDFPDRIPSGKDVDIICEKTDFEYIRQFLLAFSEGYTTYEIVIVELQGGFKIRFELSGNLIFQLHCCYKYNNIPDEFIIFALKSRHLQNNYYVMDPACEAIIRKVAYKEDNSKEYHQEYYQKHRSAECIDFFEKCLKREKGLQ